MWETEKDRYLSQTLLVAARLCLMLCSIPGHRLKLSTNQYSSPDDHRDINVSFFIVKLVAKTQNQKRAPTTPAYRPTDSRSESLHICA